MNHTTCITAALKTETATLVVHHHWPEAAIRRPYRAPPQHRSCHCCTRNLSRKGLIEEAFRPTFHYRDMIPLFRLFWKERRSCSLVSMNVGKIERRFWRGNRTITVVCVQKALVLVPPNNSGLPMWPCSYLLLYYNCCYAVLLLHQSAIIRLYCKSQSLLLRRRIFW